MNSHISKALSARSLCTQCYHRILSRPAHQRHITTSTQNLNQDLHNQERILSQLASHSFEGSSSSPTPSSLSILSSSLEASSRTSDASQGGSSANESALASITGYRPPPPPHHLHIYATRHNCHITFSNGNRQPIISVSSGNLGFRKAARGTYEAGYQLGSYVLARIRQQGLQTEIHNIEVILRDFGPGRQAITKLLLGNEGKDIRGKIIRVMDASKLKFGGTRSPKPRRLG